MSVLVERIEKLITFLLERFFQDKTKKNRTITPRVIFCFVLTLDVGFIFLTSLFGTTVFGLGFGNSMYMSIITFSTVGLGDFAPPFFAPGRPLWWRVGSYVSGALVCILGLALLSMLLIELVVRRDLSVLGLHKGKALWAKMKRSPKIYAKGLRRAPRRRIIQFILAGLVAIALVLPCFCL